MRTSTIFLPLLTLTLAACGPITKTRHDKTWERRPAAGTDDAVVAPSVGNAADAKAEGETTDGQEQDAVTATGEATQPSPSQSPTQSPTQAPVEAPALTIREIRHHGSACPTASVSANISPDRKAFTLLFDAFAVEVPEGTKSRAAYGDCELELDLQSEKGWQLTLLTVDERGYAALNDGDTARLTTDFSFHANGPKARFTTTLQGAMDDTFQRRAEADLLTAPWSGCDQTKTLRVSLGVVLKAASELPAYLAVDAVDGELHHRTGLAFRRCQ